MKRKMGIIGKTDENPKKKPRLVMYPPVIGILPPPTRPQKEILEVSEDQLGRSRLSSADDESRMITKSVLKTEFEREKGSQEELPSEQLASIMKMFKISLLNKIPIAQDKVIQELVIHLKKKQNNRSQNIMPRIGFLLKTLKYFSDRNLKESEYTIFARTLEYKYYPADYTLFNYGQVGRTFYIILEGTVGVRVPCQVEIECKAAKSGFRREMQILERLELHSGAGFGEASLLTSELRNATIVTKTVCHFATMCKSDYIKLMKHREGKKLIKTVDFFYNLPYFQERSIKQLQQMHFIFTITSIPKNHIVFDVGQKSDRIYIIKQGEFELEIDIDKYFHGTEYLKEDKRVNLKAEKIIWADNKKLKQKLTEKKEKFTMFKFATICKGQMIGSEDALLGRPFTSRLTCKTLGSKIYSCSILEFKRNFLHLPEIIDVVYHEIEERRKRICDQLGGYVRVRTYEANYFYESFKRQIREEDSSEPLPLFAEENELSRINKFLEEEGYEKQSGNVVITQKQKENTTKTPLHESPQSVEKMVSSIKTLNSVVDTVRFSKRNHFHSYTERSYQMALPSRNTGLGKGQRSFFITVDEVKKPRYEDIRTKKLSLMESEGEAKTIQENIVKESEFIGNNITDGESSRVHGNSILTESIKDKSAINSKILSSGNNPLREYMRLGLGGKCRVEEESKSYINDSFLSRYSKSLNLTYMSNCSTANLFSSPFLSRTETNNNINININNPMEIAKKSSSEVWDRIEKLSRRIEGDGGKMLLRKQKEKRVGKPLMLMDLDSHSPNVNTRWGNKTMSKFAEICRKEGNIKRGHHVSNKGSSYTPKYSEFSSTKFPPLSPSFTGGKSLASFVIPEETSKSMEGGKHRARATSRGGRGGARPTFRHPPQFILH